eukprot:9192057-Karenia_brevis.AAC.1
MAYHQYYSRTLHRLGTMRIRGSVMGKRFTSDVITGSTNFDTATQMSQPWNTMFPASWNRVSGHT